MKKITPKLDILPPAQRIIWPLLTDIPQHFVLCGGTALALQLGHRKSFDFDFFTTKQNIDLNKISETLSFTKNFNSYKRIYPNQIEHYLTIGEVNVSLTLLNNIKIFPGFINEPYIAKDIGIKIASPVDIFAMKILAYQERNTKRDWIDIAELIKHGYSLEKAFANAKALLRKSQPNKDLNISLICSSLQNKYFTKPNELLPIITQAVNAIDDNSLKRIEKSKIKVYSSFLDFTDKGLSR